MRVPTILRAVLPRVPLTAADRWIIILLWTAGMAMGWAQGEASALVPFTRVDLGLTQSGMSFVLAAARIAAFGAVLVGALSDRIGRRRPLLVALILLVVATFASALAPNPIVYGIAQSGARLGGAAVAALAVVAMAEGVGPEVRAYAIGYFGAATSLGAGISVVTLPLAEASSLGWRLPHALPVVLVLLVPFLWTRLPESPYLVKAEMRLPWGDLVRGERRRRFLLIAGAGAFGSAFSAVGLAFTTERLINELGFATLTVALITLGGGTIGGLGFFVGGRLADSWGRRPTSILSLMMSVAGGVTVYSVSSALALAVAAAISAFGSFAYVTSAGAHRAELFPTSLRGAAASAAGYLATVGSATGLLIGAVTIDRWGLLPTMIGLGVGVGIAALLTARLPETLGHDLAQA